MRIVDQQAAPAAMVQTQSAGKPTGLELEKSKLRKAAKDFESFFVYYMLKTMRQSVPQVPAGNKGAQSEGLGKEMFTDMFDAEISKRISLSKNRSLGDLLYNSVVKQVEARYDSHKRDISEVGTELKQLQPLETESSHEFDAPRRPVPFQDDGKRPINLQHPSKREELMKLEGENRKVITDTMTADVPR